MSVHITTYVNESDQNTLNKTLTLISINPISAVLKDDTDLINPTLILSNNVLQDFNYVYIQEFDRYYYVTTRAYAQQRYYVTLAVDVLMSHKDDIEDLTVIANRASHNFNLYQIDPEVPQLAYNVISTQKFPFGFGGQSFILAVTGGGRSQEPTPEPETIESEVSNNEQLG